MANPFGTNLIEPIPGLREPLYRTLYKDGKVFPKMKADEYHLSKYLARGFTLEPPEYPTPQVEDEPLEVVKRKGRNKNVCEICNKRFKNLPNHVLLAHTKNGG